MMAQAAFGFSSMLGLSLMGYGTYWTFAQTETISPDSAVSIGLVVTVMGMLAWFAHRSGRLAQKLDSTASAIEDLRALQIQAQKQLAVCKSKHDKRLQDLNERLMRIEIKREISAGPQAAPARSSKADSRTD